MFLTNLLKNTPTKQRCELVTCEEKVRYVIPRKGVLKKKWVGKPERKALLGISGL
jgi:hypothetical protein